MAILIISFKSSMRICVLFVKRDRKPPSLNVVYNFNNRRLKPVECKNASNAAFDVNNAATKHVEYYLEHSETNAVAILLGLGKDQYLCLVTMLLEVDRMATMLVQKAALSISSSCCGPFPYQ
jgi:hypothetical protein